MGKRGRPKSWQSEVPCVSCGDTVTRQNSGQSRYCKPCKTTRQRELRAADLVGRMLNNAQSSAREAGRACTITRDDIVISDRCPALGIEMRTTPGLRTEYTHSIDRLDNSKGYVPGNVRIISWRANRLKNNATSDELLNLWRYSIGDMTGRPDVISFQNLPEIHFEPATAETPVFSL